MASRTSSCLKKVLTRGRELVYEAMKEKRDREKAERQRPKKAAEEKAQSLQ
jgi:hypothetical protein